MASEAFATIKRAVLWAARSVPAGYVVSAADLGQALNIPARHVAHILSRLDDDEREMVPTHRIVPRPTGFPPAVKQTPKHRSAIANLRIEGVAVDDNGFIEEIDTHSIQFIDRYTTMIWADAPDWQPEANQSLIKRQPL